MGYAIVVRGGFNAAHHLPGVEICERIHGHSFQVEARVESDDLNEQFMVKDFRDLKATWNKYDHQDLNDFFPMPTAEVLARAIFDDIRYNRTSQKIVYVRVWESETAYAEYST